MKRYIAALLIITLLCSLAGCRSSKPQTNTTNLTTTAPTIPTTTDPTVPDPSIAERLGIYWEIWQQLNQYADRDYEFFNWIGVFVSGVPRGNAGLEYCYNFLRSMDDLKPYLNEESWDVPGGYSLPSESPEELLARFTVVEDVLLEMKYAKSTPDHGFDFMRDAQVIWRYDVNGNLVHLDQRDWGSIPDYQMPQHRFYSSMMYGDTFFEYDESGNQVSIWLGDKNDLMCRLVPTYNKSGQKIREDAGDTAFLYEYDDHGQLSKVEYRRPFIYDEHGNIDKYVSEHWVFEHTYNSDGVILKTVEKHYNSDDLDYTVVSRLQYDDKGRLCKEERDYTADITAYEYYEVITYTYDTKDRILSKTTEYNAASYTTGSIENYFYGNQYIIDDYVINFTEENLN